MRIDVEKYLVIGPWSARDAFFRKIQELGILEFISDKPPSLEKPTEVQVYVDALHVLRRMVPVKGVHVEEDYRSAHVLAEHIVDRSHQLERLREKVRLLRQDIARIEVFGDFSLTELHELEEKTGRKVQFFFTKKSDKIEAPKKPEVIFIGSHFGLDYYISINKEPVSYEGMIEIKIDHSLRELEQALASARRLIDEYETELARLAHHKKVIRQGLANTLNYYNLEDSKERVQSILDGEAFAVEGWIPKNKIPISLKVADDFGCIIEPIGIETKDRIPTYLENTGVARIGEDLINIYDTPSYTDRDPSIWVFVAFMTFFSMIIADAGYGLIFLALSLFLFFKFGKKGGTARRIIILSTYLSVGCIVWGVLLSSYFGAELPPNHPLTKLSLIDWMVEQKAEYFLHEKPKSYTDLIKEYPQAKEATDADALLVSVVRQQKKGIKYVIYDGFHDNVLIEIAIFIGALHIIISFLRYIDKNWSGLGWILFIIGGYLFFPSILGAVSLIHYIFHVPYAEGAMLGQYILYTGLGLTVILALIQKRLAGAGEIMNAIQVFADVMSYLRIYALSLAGMIMATTFNEIGASIPFLGVIVIIAGHAVNITLAIMGGLIHGLRLNFIEWYHYSFEGGGTPLHPLSLIKIE